ncbi:MAG: phosphoribosylformylglycinamidine synthase subunit PurL, partial [Candidatus Stahlbacteria bacterium]|nr:phosphoribosylformylglycinamidine synthase subunit PurL [Candidatus Stahlbacteria bacterium]
AASAVDEAIRNAVAVGADPERIALLDNFSFGNPDKPEVLGQMVRAVQGCCMAASAYRTPFISGKDSLNNEYRVGQHSIPIPPTLLISAIGCIEDVNKTVTMDLKSPGNSIYVLGKTFNELGGSHYYEIQGCTGNLVPKVRPQPQMLKSLHKAIKTGLVLACHDCSEGGIGVAIAEMCFAGGLGMQISLNKLPTETLTPITDNQLRDDWLLFSESNTRFIIEVTSGKEDKFEKLMQGCEVSKVGISMANKELEIFGLNGEIVAKANIEELKFAWATGIKI